jgi:CNT family concentrative nucleoside transporter
MAQRYCGNTRLLKYLDHSFHGVDKTELPNHLATVTQHYIFAHMDRFTGLAGIALILFIAWLMSNNRKRINYRVVVSGLLLQLLLGLFVLRTSAGASLFGMLGNGINKLLDFSDRGAEFVFGPLANAPLLQETFGQGTIFFFKIIPTIIFVSVLVNMFYHFGILQFIIRHFARLVHKIMHVSGSEALSNVSSAFVGQVEAQLMIKPYVKGMTMSELLASMSGSMACIAGGVMAYYISTGIDARFLLTASMMAAPAALVISKIVWPETEVSETHGSVKLEVQKQHSNLLDAIAAGASDGLRIGLNVAAMLIGFIALIFLVNALLAYVGHLFGAELSLQRMLGYVFAGFAWTMGVPASESVTVGGLMGTKLVINEFVAYKDLVPMIQQGALSPKSVAIATFALCGFANFSSIAIQVGGIGQIAPERRPDLAKLGFRALVCGTLASYLSAALAGILL